MKHLLLLAAAGLALSAQSENPAFEVATIKPPDPNSHVMSGINAGRGRFTEIGTLRDLICTAYGIQDYQVAGGPSWLNSERFEVDGRPAASATRDQMAPMLRTLLTDRFKLATHRETKELPVYGLIPARNGPKLHEVTDKDKPGGITIGKGMLRGQMTLADLARFLSPAADRPVLDRTGFTPVFQIDLKWSSDDSPDTPTPSLFTAIQEQLGLKLESTKGPIEVLVIDHAEKPSEN